MNRRELLRALIGIPTLAVAGGTALRNIPAGHSEPVQSVKAVNVEWEPDYTVLARKAFSPEVAPSEPFPETRRLLREYLKSRETW